MTRWRIALLSVIIVAHLGSHALVSTVGAAPRKKAADKKKTEAPKANGNTQEAKLEDITLIVPKNWSVRIPYSKFRRAIIQLPTVGGDGENPEIAVLCYGPSDAGDEAGVKRVKGWIDDFHAEGRKVKTSQGSSAQGPYTLVDISGTYKRPDAKPAKPMPGARLLGVVFEVKGKGNYLLRLTGPEKSVTAAADAFLASFGADPNSEKELKLGE